MHRTRRRSGLGWAFRVWTVVVACALAISMRLQGQAYVACTMTGALHWTTCCPEPDRQEESAIDGPSCCEHRSLPPLAKVGQAREVVRAFDFGGAVLPEPIAFASPPLVLVAAPQAPLRRWRSPAGPAPPPTASERLAFLSRYLC